MTYVYEFYTDSVQAASYDEACAYFAAHHEDFDPDEVWSDEDED